MRLSCRHLTVSRDEFGTDLHAWACANCDKAFAPLDVDLLAVGKRLLDEVAQARGGWSEVEPDLAERAMEWMGEVKDGGDGE